MGFSNLMDRFVGEEYSVIQKTKNDFRWIEASIVIEDFKPMDWILGRGSAGSWSNYSAFGGMERSMTHVGYLHLILKGGVPLLLLFFVGPLGLGLFRLMTARKWETLACAGVLVAYSIDLITGGAPEQSLKIALVFLCFGRCIADKGHLSESQFVKPN